MKVEQDALTTQQKQQSKAMEIKEQEIKEMLSKVENEFQQQLQEKDDAVREKLNQIALQHDMGVKDVTASLENMRKEELTRAEERHHAEISELNLGWERKVVSIRKEHEENLEKMLNEAREKEENLVNENVNLRNEISKKEKVQQVQLEELHSKVNGVLEEKETANAKEPSEDSSQTLLKDQITKLRAEVTQLKEREESLKSQIDQLGGSPLKGKADRPPQLNLVSNPLSENSTVYDPAPKSPVEPTEFEYLRNILYEYMMGRERKQMAKVLVALLRFSAKQQKEILQKVDEQVSQGKSKSSSWY